MAAGIIRVISKIDVCKNFGELLRRRRREARLSQKAFAREIGLSRTSVTNIERGRQAVTLPTLYAMADVLGRQVADLLPAPKTRTVHRSAKEAEWISKISMPRNGR
ncbi:MAG: helix-turn-helix transcriptional regulator [Candidatus Acidiferrales bacterium]